jgi:hypothetical protein
MPSDTAEKVHAAACSHDLAALATLMDQGLLVGPDPSGTFTSTAEVIAGWRRDEAAGKHDLDELAALLETTPRTEQGGFTFNNGRAVATFDRLAGSWSSFYLSS